MADETGLSSAFPPPPKQFELFTTENVEAFKRDPASVPDHVAHAMRPPDLPTAPYSIFGETWQLEDTMPTLEDAGVSRLYADNYELVTELKKLSRSLLVNFVELVTIMSTTPEQFPAKIEDLRLIMVNMHHLINAYRPHQTRESLISLMESQLARREREVLAVEEATAQAQEIIDTYGSLKTPLVRTQEDVVMSSGTEVQTNGTVNGNAGEDEIMKRDLTLFAQLESRS